MALSWYNDYDFTQATRPHHFISLFYTEWSEFVMATKKPVPVFSDRPEYKGFLERPLEDNELSVCDDWTPAHAEVWEHYAAIVSSGIDISSSYSSKIKATTCTFKDMRPDSKTLGYMLSARGVDAMDSLKLMIFKHTSVLTGDWSPLLGEKPRVRRG
jgi:hypothetical protein